MVVACLIIVSLQVLSFENLTLNFEFLSSYLDLDHGLDTGPWPGPWPGHWTGPGAWQLFNWTLITNCDDSIQIVCVLNTLIQSVAIPMNAKQDVMEFSWSMTVVSDSWSEQFWSVDIITLQMFMISISACFWVLTLW